VKCLDHERVRLESGLKLDINRLARRGFIRAGAATGPIGIGWTDYDGEVIASGIITADMSRTDVGHFRIQLGELDQQIFLVARPRHFGGRQWYFMCPYENRRVAVLWKPPGAQSFASRQRWGRRRVAYASQFMTPTDRAHRGKAKINSRLCAISGFDPEVNVDKSINGIPSRGIEYIPYPSARTILLGINFGL